MWTDGRDTSFVGPLDGGRTIRNVTSGRWRISHRPFLRALLTATMIAAAPVLSGTFDDAAAQRTIQIGGPKRTGSVHVHIGKSEDVRTDQSFVDIVVGDPEIADVNPLTDRSLTILGRKHGTTRVTVYSEGRKLIGVFDVTVTHDTSILAAEVARRFPYAKLRVTAVRERIMLTGTSPDAVTLDKAVQLARQFSPDVINTVTVLQPQQVMLEVRFIEVNRTAGREFGVQWNPYSKSGRFLGNIGSRQPADRLPVTDGSIFMQPGANRYQMSPGTFGGTSGPLTPAGPNVLPTALTISPVVAAGVLSGAAPFGFMIGRLIANGLAVDSLINALEQKGVARSLAEPNLIALSGDTASFLAGGEFPFPVPGALGQVTIEWKRFGVQLSFTPTVLADGLINITVEPEVSELDRSNTVQIAGLAIPPLIVRRARTTVELREGQTFVIGGLLQSKGQNQIHQLPWIGDIPVLGALFRSTRYQKDETDLAIIVTPRLVKPARPGDVIKTPLDSTQPPNDVDLFLAGRTEVTPAMSRLAAGAANRPFTGHVLDLPKGVAYVAAQ
jgi:pilus assembly protein CpaC